MKRYQEDQMRSLYQQWLESGQSKTVFAKDRQIIPTVFYYWVKKFQRQQSAASVSESLAGFSLVRVGDKPVSSHKEAVARICYPSGASIELYELPDAAFLRTLVE